MRRFELPKIYPITDARLSGLSHAGQVEQFIAGGAKFIQLREKRAAPKDFFQAAEQALKIARRQGDAKIIINDRVDIALALKADGVHLGQTDLPPDAARKILGENAIIGFSTHSVEQAIAAAELPIDYIAVGAIFNTANKEKPEAIIGLEGLREVRRAIDDFPLVAIGGITPENVRDVMNSGSNCVAMIGALLNDSSRIARVTKNLIASLQVV